jgi:hypothetical protein
VSAPASTDVLRVRTLELVDDSGQVRAQLNVEPGGEVVFRLRDPSGTIRVKLGASGDGSGLDLLNHMTEPGIQLLANRETNSLSIAEPGGAQEIIEP